MWIFLVLIYGLLKGSREIAKKKAMTKNSVLEILITYTLLSFIFVIPQAPAARGLDIHFYFLIAIKSFCIFVAWICSFNSLKNLPVSLFGIIDLSRVIFATLLGVIFLQEKLGPLQIIGLAVVCLGLLLLRFKPKRKKVEVRNQNQELEISSSNNIQLQQAQQIEEKNYSEKEKLSFVLLALISCILNAISGLFDKILMKSISSAQLQFWYMLFLVLYYLIYILIKKEKISLSVFKNFWVWLLAIMFVIGDKALFIANGMEESKITLMTLIKQSGCLVTIIGGKLFFKEKNIAYKLLCAGIIIIGIMLGLLNR